MMEVTIVGRYRVHKHKRHWIVTIMHQHGEGCISTHGSRATALAAAKRYDDSARQRHREARSLLGVLR